ncbi:MAG: hypothetical protein M0C28_24325 [Candidatus Moduliflexus flocculans]|nr:hypothetical protein [Candidatus Moduliflexus flocculans]
MLWGVPSIVYGAFGFIVMMLCRPAGLAAGRHHRRGPARACRCMTRAMDEVDPPGAARAARTPRPTLWAPRAARRRCKVVVAPVRCPGILTAVLIAFGRGIGDAAAVLFTAGFTDRHPRPRCCSPAATLPLAIFFQLGTPVPEVQGAGLRLGR